MWDHDRCLVTAAVLALLTLSIPAEGGELPVIVEYVPKRGTTVRVNRGAAVSGVSHDLLLAFLDRWIGQRPLSEEIKQSLLER